MESLKPARRDLLIVVGMLALSISSALSGDYAGKGVYRPYDALGYALLVAAVLPLAWRSRLPITVTWATWAAWTFAVGLNYPDLFLSVCLFIVYYGLASYATRRAAFINGGIQMGLLVSWTAIGMYYYDNITYNALIAAVLVVVVPIGFGLVEKRKRAELSARELEAAKRELAAHDAATDAVRAERARIARELHDVVAHEITVMTLQAEGARRRLSKTEPEVSEMFGSISQSGRRGLSEMQRMIGVLRTSEQEAARRALPSGARSAPMPPLPELAPMPSLASLPSLVETVEEAGLPVELSITGKSHVPAGVELSAYRIVQEALTNALKYAGPGARATARITRRPDAVRVLVEDDGRGTISEAAQSSGGHGLDGMAERVSLLGGSFSYGPRTGGGFRVEATLPVTDDQVGGRARTERRVEIRVEAGSTPAEREDTA